MRTGQTHLTAKGMEGSGLQVRLPSEVGYSRSHYMDQFAKTG